MSRLACLVAVALGLAAVAGAQESRATLQGTVKDPQGVVAGASVVVTPDTKTAVITERTKRAVTSLRCCCRANTRLPRSVRV